MSNIVIGIDAAKAVEITEDGDKPPIGGSLHFVEVTGEGVEFTCSFCGAKVRQSVEDEIVTDTTGEPQCSRVCQEAADRACPSITM